uniref:50S ribosomal protein L9, chloroplastic n=1 Tax=Chondria sp. (in: red algae) TaxID=1982705 RepID=A0A1Z1MRK7_9FLOR|nr:ribosomal protein L9 [Chondria sp. (in: red algae)]
MGKKVKVVIKTSKFKEQKKGNIINVSPGYAFNYLIPNNIAEIATAKKIKHFNMFAKIEEQQKKINLIENKRIENKIIKIAKITVYKKQGENNLIFGSIKEKDINDWIKKYININLEKKQIILDNINKVGINLIKIQIKTGIELPIKVYCLPNNI